MEVTKKMTLTRYALVRWLTVAAALLSPAAFADDNITIDGSFTDWANAPCVTFSGNSTIGLTKACLTNNNTSGSNGKLFSYGEGTGNWNGAFAIGAYVDLDGDGALTDADEFYGVHFN